MHNLERDLVALSKLSVRREVLDTIRAKVAQNVKIEQAMPEHPVVSPFSGVFFFASAMLIVLIAIVPNTIPGLHPNALELSYRSQRSLDGAIEEFVMSKDAASSAEGLALAVQKARSTHDTLALVGEKGLYTMADCLAAYRSYDTKLDALMMDIELKRAHAASSREIRALDELMQITQSAAIEAGKRLNEY
jgi:hypothetical protein